MERKMAAAIALAVLLAASFVPALSDEASADGGTVRISNSYAGYYRTTYDLALEKTSNEMFFKESSADKLSQMSRILDGDHKGTVPEEDSDFHVGEPIRVYCISDDVFIFMQLKYTDERGIIQVIPEVFYSPWGADFLVKAGDSFTFCVTKAVDNNGHEICCYVDDPEDLHYYDFEAKKWVSNTYRGSVKTTQEFTFNTESYEKDPVIYVDVTYEENGFSQPEGSSLLYAALFASITILIFAVLVYASLKPKWSK